eukprot:m.145778 g.145778  ORF g.145778 m.145778 type:complete len:1052 (+) comp16220_c0_seq1:117-3272(+)
MARTALWGVLFLLTQTCFGVLLRDDKCLSTATDGLVDPKIARMDVSGDWMALQAESGNIHVLHRHSSTDAWLFSANFGTSLSHSDALNNPGATYSRPQFDHEGNLMVIQDNSRQIVVVKLSTILVTSIPVAYSYSTFLHASAHVNAGAYIDRLAVSDSWIAVASSNELPNQITTPSVLSVIYLESRDDDSKQTQRYLRFTDAYSALNIATEMPTLVVQDVNLAVSASYLAASFVFERGITLPCLWDLTSAATTPIRCYPNHTGHTVSLTDTTLVISGGTQPWLIALTKLTSPTSLAQAATAFSQPSAFVSNTTLVVVNEEANSMRFNFQLTDLPVSILPRFFSYTTPLESPVQLIMGAGTIALMVNTSVVYVVQPGLIGLRVLPTARMGLDIQCCSPGNAPLTGDPDTCNLFSQRSSTTPAAINPSSTGQPDSASTSMHPPTTLLAPTTTTELTRSSTTKPSVSTTSSRMATSPATTVRIASTSQAEQTNSTLSTTIPLTSTASVASSTSSRVQSTTTEVNSSTLPPGTTAEIKTGSHEDDKSTSPLHTTTRAVASSSSSFSSSTASNAQPFPRDSTTLTVVLTPAAQVADPTSSAPQAAILKMEIVTITVIVVVAVLVVMFVVWRTRAGPSRVTALQSQYLDENLTYFKSPGFDDDLLDVTTGNSHTSHPCSPPTNHSSPFTEPWSTPPSVSTENSDVGITTHALSTPMHPQYANTKYNPLSDPTPSTRTSMHEWYDTGVEGQLLDPPAKIHPRSSSFCDTSEAVIKPITPTTTLLKRPTRSIEHAIFTLLLQGNYTAVHELASPYNWGLSDGKTSLLHRLAGIKVDPKFACDAVGCMLKMGLKLEAYNEDMRTPVMMAAANGNTPVVLALMEHGADIGQPDDQGRNTVILAACSCSLKVMRQVLSAATLPQARMQDDQGRNAMHWALMTAPLEVINVLSNFDPLALSFLTGDEETCLHVLVKEDRCDILETVLWFNRCEATLQLLVENALNLTPLQYAQELGHTECADILQQAFERVRNPGETDTQMAVRLRSALRMRFKRDAQRAHTP